MVPRDDEVADRLLLGRERVLVRRQARALARPKLLVPLALRRGRRINRGELGDVDVEHGKIRRARGGGTRRCRIGRGVRGWRIIRGKTDCVVGRRQGVVARVVVTRKGVVASRDGKRRQRGRDTLSVANWACLLPQ